MIEKLYADRISKTEPVYSLTLGTERRSRLQSVPSGPLTRSTEIASSFISTIGFVPRAIGHAVVDTFKARSARSASIQPLPPIPEAGEDRLRQVREAVLQDAIMPAELTAEQLETVLRDYKRLLLLDLDHK